MLAATPAFGAVEWCHLPPRAAPGSAAVKGFLNLAGGNCLADLERLEGDSGFSAVLAAIERAADAR